MYNIFLFINNKMIDNETNSGGERVCKWLLFDSFRVSSKK